MKLWTTGLACAVAVTAFGQIQVVVPNAYANQPGPNVFLGPFAGARTMQLIMNQNQLTGIGVGNPIYGMTWRLPTSATAPYPATDLTFTQFDVYIGQAVAPADASGIFATNFVGTPTLVRSGPLTINANSFPDGSTNPNNWGSLINFAPFTYTGGHLAIEIRHSGISPTRSLDAVGTGVAGYGTDFRAFWGSGITATSGSQANFTITQLHAVPEPGTMIALGAGFAALLARRRRRKA
jgi:hypothetical protein